MLTRRSALAAGLVCALATPAFAQTEINVATVSTTSDDYALAVAWSNVLAREGQFRMVPDGGSGTVRGLRSLAQGRIQMSPIGAPHFADALAGAGSFAEDPASLVAEYANLRALFAIPTGMAQYVTRADSDVHSFEDLRGRRMAIGRPGGNAGRVTTYLFAAHGLDIEGGDVQGEYIDFGPALDELADRRLDAALVWGGVPQAGVFNLSRSTPVRFLSPDPANLEAFQARISNGEFYVFREVSPEILRAQYGDGVVADGPMFAWTFPMMMVVHKDMADDDAYALTRAMWDNVEEIRATSDQLTLLDIATATEALSAELHPGAARFFREHGLIQ